MTCVRVCYVYVRIYVYMCDRVSKMRDGAQTSLGGCFFFNYKLAERGEENRDAISHILFYHFFLVLSFFNFFFLLTRRLCQLSACVAMISLAPLLVQP